MPPSLGYLVSPISPICCVMPHHWAAWSALLVPSAESCPHHWAALSALSELLLCCEIFVQHLVGEPCPLRGAGRSALSFVLDCQLEDCVCFVVADSSISWTGNNTATYSPGAGHNHFCEPTPACHCTAFTAHYEHGFCPIVLPCCPCVR